MKSSSSLHRVRRAALPLGVLTLGIATSALLLGAQPQAQASSGRSLPPSVRVVTVALQAVRLLVRSQGTVEPRTESQLIAEVPGQVVSIEPGLEPGGFFRAGDLLAQLDPGDLTLEVRRARAALTRARAEEDYARAMLERQRVLREQGIASVAGYDEVQRAARIAEARTQEAEIDLEGAERDLARTRIVAPFDGRTRERNIDLGSFVSVGTLLAGVYAVDYAEIRLPVPDRELAYLELPLGVELAPEQAPRVTLSTRFAGELHEWQGRIVRTEAEIDPRTRMVHVIARVPRPYESSGRPPLAAGLFVEAEIQGRRVEGLARIPRSALADERSVWVVDDMDRLRQRQVSVLRYERDTALVSAGLAGMDRISLLRPGRARDGLEVRPVEVDFLAHRDAPDADSELAL